MTDQEKRIAIAKVCGWRFHPDGRGFIQPGGNDWIGRGCKTLSECCPDYLNDLNAMHEAESTLTEYQRIVYLEHLTPKHTPIKDQDWTAFHATARQRAEAFLRTLNLWKD